MMFDWGEGADAIQRDLDAVIFNPLSLTFLKCLRFKIVSCRHGFEPSTAMVGDCLIVGLLLGLFYCCVIMVTSHTIFT
jgi:hypothetical protein